MWSVIYTKIMLKNSSSKTLFNVYVNVWKSTAKAVLENYENFSIKNRALGKL